MIGQSAALTIVLPCRKENKKSSSLISLSQDSVESGDSDFSQPVDTGQQAATNSGQEAVRNKHSNRYIMVSIMV